MTTLQSMTNRVNGLKAVMHFDNAWQLFLNRLIFRPSLEVYVYKKLRLIVDHKGGDANGARAVLATNMYRRFLEHIPSKSIRTLIDIGANGGGLPLLLLATNGNLERAICVEMNPNTFQRLRFNVETNLGASRGICLNCGVAGRSGEVEIALGGGSTGDSLYANNVATLSASEKHKVRLVTIDDLMMEYCPGTVVDLCKIDVEGAEYEIFDDESAKWATKVRYLIIEIHDGHKKTPRYAIDWLQRHGFERIAGDASEGGVHLFRQNNPLSA